MECKARADLPYPEIAIEEKDKNEVRLLMPVYSGREGETTAILNYIYYSYVARQKEPDLAECFEKIAIVEMKHHEMLGRAIAELGGTPYIGGNYSYWQGSYVNYAKAPILMLKTALNAEKQAVKDYKAVLAATKMQTVRDIVSRIIADEELHIKVFSEALEKYGD